MSETASKIALATAEEDEEPIETTVDRPPAVSLISKEQAAKLLTTGQGRVRRTRNVSLEGKFVDLVDLLPPVPVKGEFDVNKIKSSLYFFS